MNNFLPIALLLLLSSRGKNGGIDAKGISPILSMLGIDENIVSAFTGGAENFSPEKLLPVALSMMNKKPFGDAPKPPTENFAQKSGTEEFSSAPNYLKPIVDIAGDEINFALSRYFANN